MINANAKPLIALPPNMNKINTTSNVVNDVINVLENVEFTAILITSFLGLFVYILMYSLILSNTTTVSLIE